MDYERRRALLEARGELVVLPEGARMPADRNVLPVLSVALGWLGADHFYAGSFVFGLAKLFLFLVAYTAAFVVPDPYDATVVSVVCYFLLALWYTTDVTLLCGAALSDTRYKYPLLIGSDDVLLVGSAKPGSVLLPLAMAALFLWRR